MSLFNRTKTPEPKVFDAIERVTAELAEVRQRLAAIETRIRTPAENHAFEDYRALTKSLADREQRFGCLTFAQHGDDIVAAIIFEMMGIKNPSYIDIGAHHPFVISNTALLYLRGSRGVNIEANPALFSAFQVHRPHDINLNMGIADKPGKLTLFRFDETSGLNTFDPARVEFLKQNSSMSVTSTVDVEMTTVDDIMGKYCNGTFPDFLSLDVEGLDYDILNSISYEKWAPKLICVEANDDLHGLKIYDLLITKGYKLHFRSMVNLFFLQRQYLNEYDKV